MMLIGFMNVLFDNIRCLHSQIVFDYIHILIYFRDLLVLVEESQIKGTLSAYIFAINSLCHENRLNDTVVSVDIPNLCIYERNFQQKHKIFGNTRNELREVYFILALADFLPTRPINLRYSDAFDYIFGNAVDFYGDLTSS